MHVRRARPISFSAAKGVSSELGESRATFVESRLMSQHTIFIEWKTAQKPQCREGDSNPQGIAPAGF